MGKLVSCGVGKDQRPMGEWAHWIGLSVVGHCGADDDDDDAVPRDVGWPA